VVAKLRLRRVASRLVLCADRVALRQELALVIALAEAELLVVLLLLLPQPATASETIAKQL